MLSPVLVSGVIALGFAGYFAWDILKREQGTPHMIRISEAIRKGAVVFLNRQYKTLAIFTVILTLVIFLTLGPFTALTFLLGALLSGLAGYIGMYIAVRGNTRAANAARSSLKEAFQVAHQSGAVMGMSVVGLGLLGIAILYYFLRDPLLIVGFGFGGALIALFARVGGGIYTKAADMGADLVGKVEEGLPEDDPRNPAVIADLVGDNVGDVAGMGADIFESYTCAVIAAMLIGTSLYGEKGALFPLLVQAVGIFSSILAMFLVRVKEDKPQDTFRREVYVASIIVIIFSGVVSWYLYGSFRMYFAMITGVVALTLFALLTEYYTFSDRRPVRAIVEASETGTATNILTGFAMGMESTAIPVLVLCGAIFIAYLFDGIHGVAMSAVGFLSITATIVTMDAYGPVADNASGIIEMTRLDPKVRRISDTLDSVGNTTKAICKGYAIGAATLSAVALFSAYIEETGLETISIIKPQVIIGLFIGGMLSFLFCSLLIRAVSRAAFRMIREVRRQFREIPGLREGDADPDYGRCVDISTVAALKGLIMPGLLSVMVPVILGFTLGAEAVAGLIVGTIVSGLPLALLLAHGGTAWDNAKKYIEAGHMGGKGTAIHAAAVVGDTVGDPWKDTAGPSLDILMDIIGTISLLLASSFIIYAIFA